MLAAARVSLKPYRFEVGVAAVVSLVVAVATLIVAFRLKSIAFPPGCFEAYVQGPGGEFAPDCEAATTLWRSIDANEVNVVFMALIFLPFVVGLIGGIPIVARELELGTAQTAWFLWPSRIRWLGRALLPVLALLGASMVVAAVSGSILGATQPGSDVLHSTGQGPIVVVRALAAFGIGLLVGSVVGRSLPAFLVAFVLCGVLAWAAEAARFDWLFAHRVVIGDYDYMGDYGFGFAWRAPDGKLIPYDERIYQLVPPEAMEQTEDPDSGPEAWLAAHGYVMLQLGVTPEIVAGWVPIEVSAMSLIGLAGIGGTAVAVNRRRPS
jgi:hypothetical protein